MSKPFFSNCVGWPLDVGLLEFLQDDPIEIDRKRFLKMVDRDAMTEIERFLGYAETAQDGLIMEGDYHVRYFVEPQTGIPFFVHSAIEFVFAEDRDLETLKARHEARLDAENEGFQPV